MRATFLLCPRMYQHAGCVGSLASCKHDIMLSGVEAAELEKCSPKLMGFCRSPISSKDWGGARPLGFACLPTPIESESAGWPHTERTWGLEWTIRSAINIFNFDY